MKQFFRFCGIVEEIVFGVGICYGTCEYCDRILVGRVGDSCGCGVGAEWDYDDGEFG